MFNKLFIWGGFLFIILVVSACYYDVEEELYGPPTQCDTSFTPGYSSHVAPLLESKCLVCHSAASQLGGINLEGYAAVSNYVSNGRLLGSIAHSPGFSPMPKGLPKLDACDILTVERWIQGGALNN